MRYLNLKLKKNSLGSLVLISLKKRTLVDLIKRLLKTNFQITQEINICILYFYGTMINHLKIFKKLIRLRDSLLNIKSKNHIFKHYENKFINITKVLHYPNGCFLSNHVDFNYNNDSNFIVVASKIGDHYHKGGLSYEIKKKYIDIEKFLKVGDIVCNHRLIKHGVKKVKVKRNQIGRFSLVLSMHKL